jgi:hypothetical protein
MFAVDGGDEGLYAKEGVRGTQWRRTAISHGRHDDQKRGGDVLVRNRGGDIYAASYGTVIAEAGTFQVPTPIHFPSFFFSWPRAANRSRPERDHSCSTSTVSS